jgi:hypothetical protein
MELIRVRAVTVCAAAVIGLAIALGATLAGHDFHALSVLGLVAALSTFIVANARTRSGMLGVVLGGVLLSLWWSGAHVVAAVAQGSLSAVWVVDFILGLALFTALLHLLVVALRTPEAATHRVSREA